MIWHGQFVLHIYQPVRIDLAQPDLQPFPAYIARGLSPPVFIDLSHGLPQHFVDSAPRLF